MNKLFTIKVTENGKGSPLKTIIDKNECLNIIKSRFAEKELTYENATWCIDFLIAYFAECELTELVVNIDERNKNSAPKLIASQSQQR